MGEVQIVDLATARRRLRPETEPWVPKQQIAQHLGVSVRTISRWMALPPGERIPFSRRFDTSPARFRVSDADRWFTGRG